MGVTFRSAFCAPRLCRTDPAQCPYLFAKVRCGFAEQLLNLFWTTLVDRAEDLSRQAGPIKPHGLTADDIDRAFCSDRAFALPRLGQPEIGMGVIGRSGVEIEIKPLTKASLNADTLELLSINRGHDPRTAAQVLTD